MKNCFLLLLLASATVFQGCKKDDEEPIKIEEPVVEEGCDFAVEECPFGASFAPVGAEYLFPCFNPSDPNEFLYVKNDFSNSLSIHKYNLLTKQNTLIVANVYPLHQPDWSRTGWIVFSDMDWKVWKVRDNGTGLQRITSGVDDQRPVFNPAGDKIIYCRDSDGDSKMLIIDINGNPLDSICSVRFNQCMNWFYSSWNEPDRILRATFTPQGRDSELSYYNFATKQEEPALFIHKEEEVNKGFLFTDYEAVSQTKVYYSMIFKGLVEFDANAQKHRVIRPYCDKRLYSNFDISPDKALILAEKETKSYIRECAYKRKRSIVIMNIDGTNEQEITLP